MKNFLLFGFCFTLAVWVNLLVIAPGLGILTTIPAWMMLREFRILHKECMKNG